MHPILLDEKRAATWRWVPSFLHRIHRFATLYDDSCSPEILVSNFKYNFLAETHNQPQLVSGILIIDGEGPLAHPIGHLLFSAEIFSGNPMVVVLQLELDEDVPADVRREVWILLEAWAAEREARFVQILARADAPGDRKRMRLFRRMGFVEVGTMMRKPLPDVPRDDNADDGTRNGSELRATYGR